MTNTELEFWRKHWQRVREAKAARKAGTEWQLLATWTAERERGQRELERMGE